MTKLSTQLIKNINRALSDLNIELKEPITTNNSHAFSDSATNQYLKMEDTKGNFYLIRINGKLWPPFTRQDEHENLAELKNHDINTNVIYNDPQKKFQICVFLEKNNETEHLEHLDSIAGQIQKIHTTCSFQGKYSLFSTLQNSYNRLKKTTGDQYNHYYTFIITLLKRIVHDTENFVSSHNDLLPSSIYFVLNKILFVDFEYSGVNHRSYDLAFYAIKARLSSTQEQRLLRRYDSENDSNIRSSYLSMKPIVGFLLFCWSNGSKSADNLAEHASTLLFHQALNASTRIQQTMLANSSNQSGETISEEGPTHQLVLA